MNEKFKINQSEVLNYMKKEAYKPMTVQELETELAIEDADDFKEFVKMLVQMEQTGLIVRTRSDRYGLPERMNLVRGRLMGHAKGFAFVIPEEQGMDDIFIPPGETNDAMHGDTVLARVSRETSGQRREGTIVRIVERAVKQVVGTYVESKYFGFVVADDKKITNDIFVPKSASMGAVDGHKVVLQLTTYPEGRKNAEGIVTQILGHRNDPGVDILSIIYKHGLPLEFPEEVLADAKNTPEEIEESDLVGRRDLRTETIVTIDGADAKDLDDAIAVKRLANGNYHLGVHIADVSYYVQEGSPLDVEAAERGNSVYLVDRVIPMIPHRLSNGICSLNPQVDRLTMSCEMEINKNGEVVQHELFQSVIRTTERMTYTSVNQILEEKDEAEREKYEKLVPMFEAMEELAQILRDKRSKRGAIDFDFKEAKVLVDEDGHPTDVVIEERYVGERLIEEFMLVANETVAEQMHWLEVPFIYRIHEDPKEAKLQHFFEFITNFGYLVRGSVDSIHPKALQEIVAAVKGTPEEVVISTVLLRSMQQAKYEAKNVGHFGLSTKFYTHFTSPIRRYPDLIVHRLIREYIINGKVDGKTQRKWDAVLPEIAEHASMMERRAVDGERETNDMKKAQFMQDKIGEEFDGIISSVTNFGLFVELPNTVEGLVHVSYMSDDYYNYDERHFTMIGERTGNVFRIGDELTVRVINVNLEEYAIDFEIVGMKGKPRRERPSQPKIIRTKPKEGGRSQTKSGQAGTKATATPRKKKKRYENTPKAARAGKKGRRR